MASKKKMGVAMAQGKNNPKKVKQNKGPLPVTLLSGFLVGLASPPPVIPAVIFDICNWVADHRMAIT